jgi:hypothetical protein
MWGACLLAAGCMPPLGYAYPTVSFVPPVDAGPVPDRVYAFRVDVKDQDGGIEFPGEDRYVLHEMYLSNGQRSFPQVKVALDYGWVWACIPLTYSAETRHTVKVRLYRPGWRTAEIQAWQRDGRVEWREAADIATREKALDDLVSTWETESFWTKGQHKAGRPEDASLFQRLAPGSASRAHRKALLFAASEYEALLARMLEGAEAERDRVARKASALRELAGK